MEQFYTDLELQTKVASIHYFPSFSEPIKIHGILSKFISTSAKCGYISEGCETSNKVLTY